MKLRGFVAAAGFADVVEAVTAGDDIMEKDVRPFVVGWRTSFVFGGGYWSRLPKALVLSSLVVLELDAGEAGTGELASSG